LFIQSNRSGSVTGAGLFATLGQSAVIRDLGLPNANVSAHSVETGTLAGVNTGNIYNVYAEGRVTNTTQQTGGLVGVNSGSISNAYAAVTVTGAAQSGGLVGSNNAVLRNASISNSYATGSVTGTDAVGGLVGDSFSQLATASINNSYATGAVSGTSNVGGLVGRNAGNNSTVNNSFWNTETSGQASSAGGTGKTTAELQQLATFSNAGWNIDNQFGTGTTWRIYDGYTTPALRPFLRPQIIDANDLSTTYTGTAYVAPYSNFGFSTDSLFYTQRLYQGTEYVGYGNAVNAGTYPVIAYSNIQQSGAGTGYDIKLTGGASATGGALTIDPAPLTITANIDRKTYDGLLYKGGNGVSYSGFVNGETPSVLTGTLSYKGTSQGAVNFGAYPIEPTGLSSNNYAIDYNTGLLFISKAPLTLTANDLHKLQGIPYFFDGTEYLANGLVNGETIGGVDLSSLGASSKAKAINSPYIINIGNAQGGTFNPNNYNISYNTGKFYVEPSPFNTPIDHLDNVVQLGNSNNYAILGTVGTVVNINNSTFVRLGNSNNFSLISNNNNINLTEKQLSRLLAAYRVFGYIVADEIGSITNPLKTSTTEYLDSYNTPSARADDILKRFEEVDPDFGQFKHSIYQTKLLGYRRYKELGKERWSEKKHQDKQQLKQHYDNLYFIIEGNGIKLPEGSVVSSNTESKL